MYVVGLHRPRFVKPIAWHAIEDRKGVMDISIRRNEHCVIGMPRCDYVFSSTRTCFIAYGFDESHLEMSLLRKLLQERGIEAVEAGGSLAPAQSAYCAKICSKIITAQFCIVLLNNSERSDNKEVPSANVNMEYGLMLGFNKYVIPFQRTSQKLPFNVAGLDTIKYGARDFERLASEAIDQAIAATTQRSSEPTPVDQQLATFLMTKRALLGTLDDQNERQIAQLGLPLGFSLVNDFGGTKIIFFGNFTALRPEIVLWRLRVLDSLLVERITGLSVRIQFQNLPEEQVQFVRQLFANIPFWVVVTSESEKSAILGILKEQPLNHLIEVFSIDDISSALGGLQH